MLRSIAGFRQDDVGDWVADLVCLHRQHTRHRPPFYDRAWVLDDEERARRVGTELDCPLCDRAELPEGLQLSRTAGPFASDTLPAGLRRAHTVGAGRWGLLRVIHGAATIELAVEPPLRRVLQAGDSQPIPPEVPHLVTVASDGVIEVDFLVPLDGEPA